MLESEQLVFRLLNYHDVFCIAFVLHYCKITRTINTATGRTTSDPIILLSTHKKYQYLPDHLKFIIINKLLIINV